MRRAPSQLIGVDPVGRRHRLHAVGEAGLGLLPGPDGVDEVPILGPEALEDLIRVAPREHLAVERFEVELIDVEVFDTLAEAQVLVSTSRATMGAGQAAPDRCEAQ